jgi:hypothetical protein
MDWRRNWNKYGICGRTSFIASVAYVDGRGCLERVGEFRAYPLAKKALDYIS